MRLVRGFTVLSIAALLLGALLPSPAASSSVTTTLHWTTPGDDGIVGRATKYELRYWPFPITAESYALARLAPGMPLPKTPGAPDSFRVTVSTTGSGCYFMIRTVDDANNWSQISNVVYRAVTGLDVEQSPVALSFSAPWPNPAVQSVQFAYTLPQAASVQVDAFDVTGRHVKSIASGTRGAGRGELAWDLRSDAGRRVEPGIYLVHVRAAGANWVRRLVVSR